jgi:hypothetical protein
VSGPDYAAPREAFDLDHAIAGDFLGGRYDKITHACHLDASNFEVLLTLKVFKAFCLAKRVGKGQAECR